MHPGKVLRQIRLQRRLSQVALSRRSGVSNQFICDLEHGRALPSAAVVVRLARGLDMDPGDLLRLLFQDPSGLSQATAVDGESQEKVAA